MPFDPLTLSPAIWLKADAITGLSDGDPVTAWPDSSGNGRGLVQGTNAPEYKVGIINGLPVVRNHNVFETYMIGSFGSYYADTDYLTVYMVADMRAHSGTHEGQISITNSTQGTDYVTDDVALIGYCGFGNNWVEGYRSTSPLSAMTTHPGGPGMPLFTPHILAMWFDGTYAVDELYYDGAVQDNGGPTVSGGTFAADEIYIGCRKDNVPNYPTDTDYAEILIYNAYHGSTDRANVYSYLIDKWLTPPPEGRGGGSRYGAPSRINRASGGWAR